MSPPTNEDRIVAWIRAKPIGATFFANEVTKDLNFASSKSTGRILSRQGNIRCAGRQASGNTVMWEKVAA